MSPRPLLVAALLVAATLCAYLPALTRAGWIWDDDAYVTNNPTLEDADGLRRMWTEPRSIPQYYPLVHTSYWIERRLWGRDPHGYHATNVLLHALGAVLLWRLLVRLRVPGALFAAALFALHPVQVESVAWVTERKNVLSGVCALGAALCWFRFRPPDDGSERHAALRRGSRTAYAAALALFALALLAKTVTATLPAALLVVTWWKRGRIGWKRDVLPLVPFLVLGAALGLHTAHLERTHVGASGPDWDFTLVERGLIAARAVWFYAAKLVWPHPLVFIYPRWRVDPAQLGQWLFPLGAALALAAAWLARRRIGRGALAGLLLFGGTLLPASGLFDVYPMRFSFVADHFQYLACIGLLALGAATATRLAGRLPSAARVAACGLVLAVLAALTWRQQADYADEVTLWKRTLAKNPGAWIAHNNLAFRARRDGDAGTAIYHFLHTAQLRPDDPHSHNTLGSVHHVLGEHDQARAAYERALAVDPDFAMTLVNLGLLEFQSGRRESALELLERALALEPDNVEALVNLGGLHLVDGEFERAKELYRRALALDPANAEARLRLDAIERHR
jgi:tetratricopeptide (TPR) repeat protein